MDKFRIFGQFLTTERVTHGILETPVGNIHLYEQHSYNLIKSQTLTRNFEQLYLMHIMH